jgi:Xaa-Pro dipeptidase
MRFLEIDLLKQAEKGISFSSGEDIFREIYIQKDEQEIEATKKAIDIAQKALLNTLPHIKVGKTEKEIANLLVINLLNAAASLNCPSTRS